jgi:hypothetical protein
MKIQWQIDREDVVSLQALITEQSGNPLVRHRARRNLAEVKSPVTRQDFWRQMVSMRLTSQQRSGPESDVGRFIRKAPFPLSYEATLNARSVRTVIAETLKESGLNRFHKTIPDQLAKNFQDLERGEWARTLEECNRLTRPVAREVEAGAANYIQSHFLGFGPKQARNLLQALGLTRYEIPIDSRVTGWLNKFGFPVRLSAAALADINYYEFVSDGIQALCARCEVFPCMLDAAIFVSKGGEAWTDDILVC